jgi:hypothetical protein
MKIKVSGGRAFNTGMIDMPLLGNASLLQPKIFPEVAIQLGSNLPMLSLLAALEKAGGNFQPESVSSNIFRWPIYSRTEKPVIIKGYVGSPTVGNTFEIHLENSWFRVGTHIRLEDDYSIIRLTGSPSVSGNIYKYAAQVVGNEPGKSVDLQYLTPGRYVNFAGSSFEEGSETGISMFGGGLDYYVQAMTTIRTERAITGDAISTATVVEIEGMNKQTGAPAKAAYWLPDLVNNFKQTLMQEHLQNISKTVWTGIANFNPVTYEVYNTSDRNIPVLTGSGFKQQMEGATTFFFNPNDNSIYLKKVFSNMIERMGYHSGMDTYDFVILGGRGFCALWQKVMSDIFQTQNTQISINMGPDSNDTGISVGYKFNRYVTSFGSIAIIENTALNDPTEKSTYITVDGMAYKAEDFVAYGFPIKRMTDGNFNMMLCSKGKDQINRALIMRYIPGMTGAIKGGLVKNAFDRSQNELVSKYPDVAKVLNNLVSQMDSGMAATSRDAEMIHLLSQLALVVKNPTEFVRILPEL